MEEYKYRQGGLNEAQNLIRTLSGDDWEVDEGYGSSKLNNNRSLSIGGDSSPESGFHAYYRTKKAGAGSKALMHGIRAAGLIEEMESVLTAKDADTYFGRTDISDAVKKDFAAGAMRDSQPTITKLALLDALGLHDEADKAWAQAARGVVTYPVGTNKNDKYIHPSRTQEAREIAGREIAGWLREAMDRCEEGSYSSLISSGMAIDKAISKYDWWKEPPAQSKSGSGSGTSGSGGGKKGAPSAGQKDTDSLDHKIKKLTKNQREDAALAEQGVEAEQERLDNAKPVDKLSFLGGTADLWEVKGKTHPLSHEFGAAIKGQLSEMVDPKRTRLRDSGNISVSDAWQLAYGEMEVWEQPQRKTGKLLVLADYSGSVNCVCGRAKSNPVGAIITGIAHGLATPFRNSEVWAYSNGRQKLPPGQRGVCSCDGMRSYGNSVFGGGTPDLEMLKWAVQRQRHMDGTSIVIVCDGGPNDPVSVRRFADELVKGGVRFCSVLVGSVRHQRRRQEHRRQARSNSGLTQQQAKQWMGQEPYPTSASVFIDSGPWRGSENPFRGGSRKEELAKLSSVFKILQSRH